MHVHLAAGFDVAGMRSKERDSSQEIAQAEFQMMLLVPRHKSLFRRAECIETNDVDARRGCASASTTG